MIGPPAGYSCRARCGRARAWSRTGAERRRSRRVPVFRYHADPACGNRRRRAAAEAASRRCSRGPSRTERPCARAKRSRAGARTAQGRVRRPWRAPSRAARARGGRVDAGPRAAAARDRAARAVLVQAVAARGARRVLISIWEHDPGRYIYAFPRTDRGVQVAHHISAARRTPTGSREVRPDEVAEIRALLQDARCARRPPSTAVCMYTKTPDRTRDDATGARAPSSRPCSGRLQVRSAISRRSAISSSGWTRHDLRRFAANRWNRSRRAAAPSPA